MRVLMKKVTELGAKFVQKNIDSFTSFGKSIVINCTGIGSKDLAKDSLVHPIRGQIVMGKPITGVKVDKIYIDEEAHNNLSYIVPRSDGVLMGGTAEVGEYSTDIGMNEVKTIIQRCSNVIPELSSAQVIKYYAALRPARAEVRLQSQQIDDTFVVHNYGHSGSGWSLCWGVSIFIF